MFYRKRIAELETRVNALERKVSELIDSELKMSADLDELTNRYKERSNRPKTSTIPNRRHRKNSDGKEDIITTRDKSQM